MKVVWALAFMVAPALVAATVLGIVVMTVLDLFAPVIGALR